MPGSEERKKINVSVDFVHLALATQRIGELIAPHPALRGDPLAGPTLHSPQDSSHINPKWKDRERFSPDKCDIYL